MAKVALLFRGRPLRQLTRGATRTGGRNNQGRITSFHRGGGAKRLFRVIDMKRNVPDLTGTVERIEYDPFRTGRTALIRWDQEPPASTSGEGSDDGEGKRKSIRIKDVPRGALPRGIHDLPRTALRSAVATICGLSSVPRKVKEPMTVVIDGRKKFSSLARETYSNLPSYLGFTKEMLDMHHTSFPSTESIVELALGNSVSKVAYEDTLLDAQQKAFKKERETNTTLQVSRGIADLLKGFENFGRGF